ncbi:hypothetical protein [Ectopseudomonas khazarica]|uniref:hypothetical protein n=1 Tax=Ectopseudomonas khazarica TaxID=2502979 RepID=UPI0037C5664A
MRTIEAVLPYYLWRYMKPSIISGTADESVFDLRIDPPEDYVSMFEGVGADYFSIANSALKNILSRRKVSRSGRIVSLDLKEIDQTINYPQPLVGFREYGRPHFGMHYLTGEEHLVLEVQTMLEVMCPQHPYTEKYEVLPAIT